MCSWYNTGFDGIAKEEARLASLTGPGRLWIPPGEQRELVFIDSTPACIYEHNPRINNTFRNWMTCLQGIHDFCPACRDLGANTRYYCGYFTVVDCSKWKDRKGNDHQYEIMLLQAKLKTLKKFRRKKEERGSLAGCLYRATREDEKSPVCGDEFEFVREVDMGKMLSEVMYRGKKLLRLYEEMNQKPENRALMFNTFQLSFSDENANPEEDEPDQLVVPFNYEKVLAPMTPKDMADMLGGAGEARSRGEAPDTDDVPF